jgi:hypothetical protein
VGAHAAKARDRGAVDDPTLEEQPRAAGLPRPVCPLAAVDLLSRVRGAVDHLDQDTAAKNLVDELARLVQTVITCVGEKFMCVRVSLEG